MKFRSFLRSFFVMGAVLVIGYICVAYYSFIFSRHVTGVIEKVERIDLNIALMQSAGSQEKLNRELYSFAVAVKEKSGEIVTASAEDRQWAVVQTGQCVEAKYYPYPPWKFDKAGTYFGARLLKLWDCSADAGATK